MAFKGEIGAEFLDNVKTGFTVGDIYRIIDAGKLGGVDIPFGTFVEWTGTAWKVNKDMQYAVSATGESLNDAIADVLDDHDTASAEGEITVPTAEAVNYKVGNYFEQDGEVWKYTDKNDNGNGTWTIDTEKVNGVVPALNELANEISVEKLSNIVLYRKDSGAKVIYNETYHLMQEQSLASTDVYIFKVVAGRYRASNVRGSSDHSNPLVVASNYNDVSTAQARAYTQFVNGSSSTVINIQDLEFDINQDGYIYINCSSSKVCSLQKIEYENIKEAVDDALNINHWRGKKVAWLGTSVPYGSGATTSYVKILQDALKFNLVPAVIPGQGLHAQYDNDSSLWYPLTYGSTCLTKAEYEAAKTAELTDITIDDSPIVPWVPGGNWQHYNNYYRTWENVLTPDNADIDLFVLDVVPNNTSFDLDDFNAFDFSNWKYSDDSAFEDHRGTFLGALLYLINKIYTFKPTARILLFLGSAFKYSDGKSNFEKLTAKGVELLDIWGDVNLLKPSLDVIKSDGGTDNHPSTFGHEVLGKRLIGRFLSVS